VEGAEDLPSSIESLVADKFLEVCTTVARGRCWAGRFSFSALNDNPASKLDILNMYLSGFRVIHWLVLA
jgi:dienelactone hydrolase